MPTQVEEDALLRKYNLPPDTNREVLYRVLASLGAGASSTAASARPSAAAAPSPAQQRTSSPPRRAASPPRRAASPGAPRRAPSDRAPSEFGGSDAAWTADEGGSASASASALRSARAPSNNGSAALTALESELRMEELQHTLARRTAQLRSAEMALVEKDERLGALRSRLTEASQAAPPRAPSPAHPRAAAAVPMAGFRALPLHERQLGGGVIQPEQLFARGRSGSPAFVSGAGGAVLSGAPPPPPGGVAALQARMAQLAARAAAEAGRRRAAEDGRAQLAAQRDAALSRAAATERELADTRAEAAALRDALAHAQSEVVIKEEECRLMAEMVKTLQASIATSNGADPSSEGDEEGRADAGGWAATQRAVADAAAAVEYPWRRGDRSLMR